MSGEVSNVLEVTVTAYSGLASVEVVAVESSAVLLEARTEPPADRERPALRLVQDEA